MSGVSSARVNENICLLKMFKLCYFFFLLQVGMFVKVILVHSITLTIFFSFSIDLNNLN